MQLAIAVYNNNVDDDDELEFRKGDVLTVLIENPHGFDGWWLCKHMDKCGLCPGNRLKLIQNTELSPVEINAFTDVRLSTASIYDSLSSHDYDNPHQSDFISSSEPAISSPECSLCSSGIYSTNDLHLSSSSSDLHPTTINNTKSVCSSKLVSDNHDYGSLFDLDQLEKYFQKLSIRSSLIHKYRQVVGKTNIEGVIHLFTTECYQFLQHYGSLLDRYTYRLIKENLLHELEHHKPSRIQLATNILRLISLQLQEKLPSSSSIGNDVFKRLHLEPIEEISTEKISTSHSSAQIYEHPRSQMKTSKTCHSNFLTSYSHNKLDNYDYIDEDDDYSINPLIRCYYRHVNEQIDLIIKRYSHLLGDEKRVSLLVSEGKRLVVAGHKLVFVLETLREHLQRMQTSLMHLTTQLCAALTSLIQLLKQFGQQNRRNLSKLIMNLKENVKMIMNIVRKIEEQCS